MQLINAPAKLVLPFANAGAKNTIPTASQIGIVAGAASLVDGFPPLTRTPLAAGGVPPSGLDMNGILYELSAVIRWANAGGGYPYDASFATDTNIQGYPKGARILRSDGTGYWFNTTDGNTTDPEGAGAIAAGWVPDFTTGAAAVTMTSANVTLTALQYGKPIIIISGLLTANLNLIFPNIVGEWTVINNTTGAFTITAKTAAGTGVTVTQSAGTFIFGDATNIYSISAGLTQAAADLRYLQLSNYHQLQPITVTQASNILTGTFAANSLDYRNATAANGTPNMAVANGALTLAIPATSNLGMVLSGGVNRLVWAVAYNAGTPVLCVANIAGGLSMDETGFISPTTIGASSNSASTWYSASAVAANSPYRIVGFSDVVFTTGTGWSTPSLVQPIGGQALAAMSSLGYGQTWQNVTGSRALGTTYYNTTGKPIFISVHVTLSAGAASLSVNGIQAGYVATTTGVAGQLTMTAIVPANGDYTATNVSSASLSTWTELR